MVVRVGALGNMALDCPPIKAYAPLSLFCSASCNMSPVQKHKRQRDIGTEMKEEVCVALFFWRGQ